MRGGVGSALGLLLGACQLQLAVPDGANVECEVDADCPSGYGCRRTLGLCVELGASGEPPRLTDVSLTPPVARAGVPVTLELRASEVLLTPPVAVIGGSPGHAMQLEDAVDAPQYRFVYEPTGDEAEGTHAV